MRKPLVSLALVYAATAICQAQTGSATANGMCNISNTGTITQAITITGGCGIGADEAKKIVTLLNRILVGQSLTSINKKLDALMKVASQPTETTLNQTAGPNSPNVSGTENQLTNVPGSVTQSNAGGCNQQVVGGSNNTTNCEPPEAKITMTQSPVGGGAAPKLFVTFTTDQKLTSNIAFTITFDGPVGRFHVYTKEGEAGYTGPALDDEGRVLGNVLRFSFNGFPSEIPKGGEIHLVIEPLSAIKVLSWKRGMD